MEWNLSQYETNAIAFRLTYFLSFIFTLLYIKNCPPPPGFIIFLNEFWIFILRHNY